ncbi:hypothetical protein SAMN05444170_5724 [Bradyrhizobium erythrophlei]|uniref:Uncharacterized protein n=1 Tax=Bradyrhizobium erythrophlei TaxID=1437360 RepID=A0A1M7ULX5_9BRAD|nr:hypothetical protein SAMN05444170_5724 [Bradyrhizobium erythrophlei]
MRKSILPSENTTIGDKSIRGRISCRTRSALQGLAGWALMGQVSLDRMHQKNAGTDRCSDRNDNFEHWTGSQKQVR